MFKKTGLSVPIFVALFCLGGCSNPVLTGSQTTLEFENQDGVKVKYKSAKDQDVEYVRDESGAVQVRVKSEQNGDLVTAAAAAQAEVNQTQAETAGKLIEAIGGLAAPKQ